MQDIIQHIATEFTNRFGEDYTLIKSPGRVNLIGEHTDYNGGYVMPAAIDKSIILAIAANGTNECELISVDKQETYRGDISGAIEKSKKGWPNYLLGVVDQLRKQGYEVSGFDCVFGGNVPIGAGMSSSAALEGGVLYGLTQLFDLDISPLEMAKIAQEAENEFVGVQCGIMDQFASLNGREGQAIKLDCRSLEFEYVPFSQEEVRIVLCDTGVRRELASSEYNVRREQCEEGVGVLQQLDASIASLRDVELAFLLRHQHELDPTVFKRCKYVVEENTRVIQAGRDLAQHDLKAFGQRMYQSHAGLRVEYEVSCSELDALVDIARDTDGVYGARMMGGGFGGCTINLVGRAYVEAFTEHVRQEYAEKMGPEIDIYQTNVSRGTHVMAGTQVDMRN